MNFFNLNIQRTGPKPYVPARTMQAHRLAESWHAASSREKITPTPQERNAVISLAAGRAGTSDRNLIQKLRIQHANFSYLHCSND
ncbi:hypothetical protein NPIL_361651 [Nephila pilipes]|uniref:Uncharacterized protein n=1 Tax=Nephila pilipes TaxID=299642 RepID=A0A8X6Q6D2_NEPPI|nr:hypothetical protein NPIL_361651 [Nephila pilipes]